MMEIDKIKERIESVVTECKEILEIIDSEIEKSNNVSFQQIKEIETTILRFDKQGLKGAHLEKVGFIS
jgi:transcription termination factor NusB